MNITTLAGPKNIHQYENIKFFKKGGMGEIYKAKDNQTDETKAIKIVPVENIDENNLLLSEFNIMTSMKDNYIVDIEFYSDFTEDNIKYLYCVMPFFTQGNLRDLIKSQMELIDLKTSIKLMLDLTKGIEKVHEKVVHRDLKPENILINDNDDLCICDFGLAKLIDVKTRTKSFKGSGTFPYMAPECWMLDSNTRSMDIYSLGIIFYEILTLKQPFNGLNEREFRTKHLYETLPDISSFRADLPIRLTETILKMTNKRPEERYSTISDVKKILEEIESIVENPKKDEIGYLLQKANQKISLFEKEKLEKRKELEKNESQQQFIEYSINSLFNKFQTRINQLNDNLERIKIGISRETKNMTVNFVNKSFTISFYSLDITKVIQQKRQVSLDFQNKKYGFIIQQPETSYLEKDNIVLIGQMILNGFPVDSLGYNLLLKKTNPEDLYGEWWVVWFEDSGLSQNYPRKLHYAISPPDFFDEYEYGRGRVTHVINMYTNTLEAEGVDKIIEKILE